MPDLCRLDVRLDDVVFREGEAVMLLDFDFDFDFDSPRPVIRSTTRVDGPHVCAGRRRGASGAAGAQSAAGTKGLGLHAAYSLPAPQIEQIGSAAMRSSIMYGSGPV